MKLRQNFVKYFVWFLGNEVSRWNAFEIYWPLASLEGKIKNGVYSFILQFCEMTMCDDTSGKLALTTLKWQVNCVLQSLFEKLKWFTCVLVYYSWLSDHEIYLKPRIWQLFCKAEQIPKIHTNVHTKWQLFSVSLWEFAQLYLTQISLRYITWSRSQLNQTRKRRPPKSRKFPLHRRHALQIGDMCLT